MPGCVFSASQSFIIVATRRPFSHTCCRSLWHRTSTTNNVRCRWALTGLTAVTTDTRRYYNHSSLGGYTEWSKSSEIGDLNENQSTVSGEVRRLFEGLLGRDRGCLAQAITLVESTNPKKKIEARVLLSSVLRHFKRKHAEQVTQMDFGPMFRVRSWALATINRATYQRIWYESGQTPGRCQEPAPLTKITSINPIVTVSYMTQTFIGISGPPGAGKSTFIEALGRLLTSQGHRVAVLAIDPSSSTTGGSLLGDKTRMAELSRDPNAYIRPTPNSGKMGGVARNTNDAIVLCECAGYDLIIVETVGVGQSEYCVVDMVDIFVLLIPPAGGDELQGIKKGIVELSDLILVNKADGDLAPAALRIQYEYTSALKFVRARSKVWKPKVQRVSSFTKEGLAEAWQSMLDYRKIKLSSGELQDCRRRQHTTWMWNHISDNILRLFKENPRVQRFVHLYEEQVAEGFLTPGVAADRLLEEFVKK